MLAERLLRPLNALLLFATAAVSSASSLPNGGLQVPTGGPGGTFDWVVPSNAVVFLDTAGTTLIGGPAGAPTTTQLVEDGIVQVRDWIVEEGALVRVSGPFPLQVYATGEIRIEGTVDLSGFDAKDVNTLNTANIPEPGAIGGPGGGRGGASSTVTNGPTPSGSPGTAAFGQGSGGLGGESQFSPPTTQPAVDQRRPGGGGGGRFARDRDVHAAEDGFDGHPLGFGALTGTSPARGGPAGPSAFLDGVAGNDFWGARILAPSGTSGSLNVVRGELPCLWAGSGGGGGGDALGGNAFPAPNWTIGTDEKGGPGGGGGGGAHFVSLQEIRFGDAGTIRADGGMGATGENTFFLDHIGGSGGSGSGGHVVLSAPRIDFSDGGTGSGARTFLSAVGGPRVTGPPTTGGNVSFGGAGGRGVIQLHVPDPLLPPSTLPTAQIVLPAGVSALSELSDPTPFVLLPLFDAFGTAPDALPSARPRSGRRAHRSTAGSASR